MGCSKRRQFQLIRVLVILTAILTLVQGIGYLGLSIWSILVHKCLQIPIKNPLEKVIYFIYFRDSECGEMNWSNDEIKENVIPNMPNITKIASRTFYIFIFYAIISSLWIITSLMVLGAFCSIVNRRAYRVCFLPWLIFILLGSALDVISTVFFVNDIFYTETAEQALDYLSVKNTFEMMTVLKDYDKYFSYPAIRLSLISSRFILLWIYNVVASIFCVKLTKLIIRTNEINKHKPLAENLNEETRENPNSNNNNHRSERRTFEPLKTGGPIIKSKKSPSSSPEPKTPKPDIPQRERHESLSSRKVDNVNDLTERSDSPVHQLKSRHNQQYNQQFNEPHNQQFNEPHHQKFNEPHHQQYNGSNSPQPRDSYRNPYEESTVPDSLLCKPERRSVNAELRSQLPWSYFGPRNDTNAPKHTLTHLSSPNEQSDTQNQADEHEVLPPIPVPDYTLHFPKDDRPSVVKNYNNSQQKHQNREKSSHNSQSPRNSAQPYRW